MRSVVWVGFLIAVITMISIVFLVDARQPVPETPEHLTLEVNDKMEEPNA